MPGPCRPRRGAWIWFSSLSKSLKGCEQGVYIFTAGWGWDCRGQEQSILFILEGPGRQQKMQTRWEAELEPRSVCR